MSSLITNTSAMNALQTLRNVNTNLATTQDRIGTGLKISSAKDNAAYFSISESMKGDRNMYAAIDEGLTLTKNSLATARLGAESFQKLAGQFVERVGFAQSGKDSVEDIEKELLGIVEQMKTTLSQATFNGDDFVNAKGAAAVAPEADKIVDDVADAAVATPLGQLTAADQDKVSRNIVTGISRASGTFAATTMKVDQVDLAALLQDFTNLAAGFKDNGGDTTAMTDAYTASAAATDTIVTTKGAEYLKGVLASAEKVFAKATEATTSLGLSEKAIERQQDFLKAVTDTIDTGVGAMVDADMEEEAARLQALQVQQQLATQSLSIANQGPQNLLSLFR